MVGGQRAQAVRGQELVLVEQPGEELLEPVEAHHAQQQPLLAGLAAQHAELLQLLPVVQALAPEEIREMLAQRE